MDIFLLIFGIKNDDFLIFYVLFYIFAELDDLC
jgi:hypothetical protein